MVNGLGALLKGGFNLIQVEGSAPLEPDEEWPGRTARLSL